MADIWAMRAYEHLDQRMGRGNKRGQENQTSEILLVNKTLNFFKHLGCIILITEEKLLDFLYSVVK